MFFLLVTTFSLMLFLKKVLFHKMYFLNITNLFLKKSSKILTPHERQMGSQNKK